MKNDNVRDYITAAFRFYASVGGYEKYKRKLGARIMERLEKSEGCSTEVSKPTEAQIVKVEEQMEAYKADLLDLYAVENTKKRIEQSDLSYRNLIWQVIEMVYMFEPDKAIERNDITNRVIRCCGELSISTASAYRYLATARHMYAKERGLRIDNNKLRAKFYKDEREIV